MPAAVRVLPASSPEVFFFFSSAGKADRQFGSSALLLANRPNKRDYHLCRVALSAFFGKDLANPTGHLQELWPISACKTGVAWHCVFSLPGLSILQVILAGQVPQNLEAGAFFFFASSSLFPHLLHLSSSPPLPFSVP
jgi:hypothetical protein